MVGCQRCNRYRQGLAISLTVVLMLTMVLCAGRAGGLPLKLVANIPLSGRTPRMDYESLDLRDVFPPISR